MRTRELFLQGCLFTISSLASLFFLSIVVHFPLGRVLFAALVSGICLIAECFVLFKVAQFLWRWSGKAALAIVRISQPHQSASDLLTETKN